MGIKDYITALGFTNLCYTRGVGRNLECYSDLEGMYATVNYDLREIEFSTIDGLIKSSVTMGYPNDNIPYVIRKLKRHVFEQQEVT